MSYLQYLTHNTPAYCSYTAGLNPIYTGKILRMFIDVDYFSKSYGDYIGSTLKAYALTTVADQPEIYSLSVDLYVFRALYSLRPTFIFSDIININGFSDITDNSDTSLELSVNFYNNDSLIVTKTYTYTLNKQKINTVNCIDSVTINSKISKITVSTKSKINATAIPLPISVTKTQSYGEFVLYC